MNFCRVQEHGGEPIIPFSCVLEKKLADMPEDEAAKYCEENKLQRQVLLGLLMLFSEKLNFKELLYSIKQLLGIRNNKLELLQAMKLK